MERASKFIRGLGLPGDTLTADELACAAWPVAVGKRLAAHTRAAKLVRKKLIVDLQKRVLEQAYYMPGLWWTRNVVHWTKVKNYVAPPSHYTNQKLQDVWLAED